MRVWSNRLSSRRLGAALAAWLASSTLLVACGGHSAGATSASPGATASTAVPASVPGSDWTRFGYDAQRSDVGPANTGIGAAGLGALQTRLVQIDGTVDSSPIELHDVVVGGRARDVVIVTTTYGRTIAIDAATGAKLWEYVPGDLGSYQGSSQITTATPIADPDRRYVYSATPNGRIHKLLVSTGAEVHSGHWPVRVTFDPTREKLASALNLSGRWVIVATGGYLGDAPTYEGHVVVLDRSSGSIVGVWNAECSDRHHLLAPPDSCRADTSFGGSAIWSRAGVVVAAGSRRLLVATGNGPFNGSTNWGDSVLELSPDARRLLHNWTPRDQARLNANDADLGSTAPAVLPPTHGYRLVVQGGKDGILRLLNLTRLDGSRAGAGRRLGGEIERLSSPGGGEVLTAPAVSRLGRRIYVFVAEDSGTAGYVLNTTRRPQLHTVWTNPSAGTSPVLAGGLLYVYDEQDGSLKVYNPVSGHLLRALPAARGHWNSPIVAGGRIILPTGSANDHATRGEIFIYHLPGS